MGLNDVPDQYKTQEMFIKTVEKNQRWLKDVPDQCP